MRAITLAVAALMCIFSFSAVTAEQAKLQVPQSMRLQHEQIVSRLEHFASRKGAHSAAAQRAVTFLKKHYAKEEEFVLPTLSLLPRLAKGEIAKDMEPAIAMADRTKSAQSEFQNDHINITSLMNELIEAGKKKRDEELVRFATRVAAQSLNDIEVAHPTAILIGDYVRLRLSRP
jgi:hypothetical protein